MLTPEQIEEMGMTMALLEADLLQTKKALEEAQQQIKEIEEHQAAEQYRDIALAEAQQTIARQREALIATGLPEWAVDAIGKGETQP